MPELPEVETIKKGLDQFVVGRTITDVDVRTPKTMHGDAKQIIGGKVKGVRRYGKGLIIDLSNGYSLAVHVKMTGQLIYRENHIPASELGSALPDKFTRVVFTLDKGILFYRDMRLFGWIYVLKTEDVMDLPYFKELGPEPFKDLTEEKFIKILQGVRSPIKVTLMDQKRMAGIGNIYANDALYRAKIHPKRPANSLTEQEAKALFAAIEEVLKKGIEAGGASEWQYVDIFGGKGKYQNFFLVYRKDGKPCPRCGTIIESIRLGGRGTFFCPECQVLSSV